MKQFFLSVLVVILTSLYFFPFNTVWLPSVNTKMALAALAPILLIISGAKFRNAEVSVPIFILSLCGLTVSLVGLIAVFYNNTHDYAYASYFVSMWVWLGGAYVVVKVMERVYGGVTFRIVGNVLITVCVIQCILAQLIDNYSSVAEFVDSFMVSTGFMGKAENRLYGIGCALDVAGMKFAAVLIIIAYFCVFPNSDENSSRGRWIYINAFFIISIFGSMIARTATIGLFLSVILWGFLYFYKTNEREHVKSTLMTFCLLLLILLPVIFFFYKMNPNFRGNIRFAFEGFFSLAEKGKWIVKSNQMMESMIIWPDNIKTWIIGDGYFQNPMKDFYYIGPTYDYYMGVDPGYCRFIFYFGLLGLLAFSSVFIVATIICCKHQPRYAVVFPLFLLLNFICWVKVSSDIFPLFAVFLWLSVYPEESSSKSERVVEKA